VTTTGLPGRKKEIEPWLLKAIGMLGRKARHKIVQGWIESSLK
jgi:hypothetical protein